MNPATTLGLRDWAAGLPIQFHINVLGVEVWQWIGLAVLAVLSLAIGQVASYFSKSLLARIGPLQVMSAPRRTKRQLHWGAVVVVGCGAAMSLLVELALNDVPNLVARRVIELGAIVGSTLFLIAFWNLICDGIQAEAAGKSKQAEKLLVPVTRKLVGAVIAIAAGAVVLGVFGVNPTGLVAGLGLGGIVFALAAKDSVENVFGSITILFDMPFTIGDWVKIDKVEGVVEQINLRSTKIRSFEDTLISLPNANLIRAAVENFGSRRVRRQRMLLRFHPHSSADALDKFCSDLTKFINGMPEARIDRTVVTIDEPMDAAIGVLVMCFFHVPSFAAEKNARHRILSEATRLRDTLGLAYAGDALPSAK